MHLSRRDMIATALVVAAIAVWALHAGGAGLPGMGSVRVSALVMLVCGFAASASAVVPTFTQLLHGNKVYLVTTSLLGVVALVSGTTALVSASTVGLAVLAGAMVALWLIATMHHQLPGGARSTRPA